MPGQTVAQICFDFFSRLPIVVEPEDVQVSSDAGILPIRQFDGPIGLTAGFIACLEDPRDPDQTEHSFPEMVRQQIFGILPAHWPHLAWLQHVCQRICAMTGSAQVLTCPWNKPVSRWGQGGGLPRSPLVGQYSAARPIDARAPCLR